MIVARRAALVAAAVLFVGCGANATTPGPTTSSPAAPASPSENATPTAPASAWAIDDAVRASADPDLVTALGALPAPSDGARYAFTALRDNGDWALVAIADAAPPAASDSGFAIAVRADGQWRVVLATDTPAFCAALAEAPAGALTQDERDYFMGCN